MVLCALVKDKCIVVGVRKGHMLMGRNTVTQILGDIIHPLHGHKENSPLWTVGGLTRSISLLEMPRMRA